MTEQYDFMANNGECTFFNTLLLESENVEKMLRMPNFNSRDMTVDLKVNGVTIKVQNFNEYMNGWYGRVKEEISEELGLLEKSDAVMVAAEKMLKDKCADAMEILQSIEDCALRVYED